MSLTFNIADNLIGREELSEILSSNHIFKITQVRENLITASYMIDDEHTINLFLDVQSNELYGYNIVFNPLFAALNDDFQILWKKAESSTPICKINVKDDAYTLVFLTADNKLFMQSFIKHKVWKQGKIKQYNWEENNYPLGLKDLIEFLKKRKK